MRSSYNRADLAICWAEGKRKEHEALYADKIYSPPAKITGKNYFNCQRRCPVIEVDWRLRGSGKSSISVNRELNVSAIHGFPTFKGSGNTHSPGMTVNKCILLSMTSAFSARSEVTRGFGSAWIHHGEPSIPVVLQGQRRAKKQPSSRQNASCLHHN